MAPVRTFHCTLLCLILHVVASQLTYEDMDYIVDLHNMYRTFVKPEAADMTRMTWNKDCQLVAEKYASECMWEHNPEVENIFGENIFMSTGPFNVSNVLIDWFNEHKHYDYENDQCSKDEMCGHYTQMVWAKTTSVGCAAHFCDTVQGLSFQNAILVVCNYHPLGNVVGYKPYQTGEPCSKCPEDHTCVNMLCDKEHADIIPSTDTEHKDIIPNTDTEDADNITSTKREHIAVTSKAATGALFARPLAVGLMLAGIIASLVF